MSENTATKQMLTEKQVLGLIRVGRSTLRRMIERKEFPESIEIAPRRKAWLDEDVAEWQVAKIKQRASRLAA